MDSCRCSSSFNILPLQHRYRSIWSWSVSVWEIDRSHSLFGTLLLVLRLGVFYFLTKGLCLRLLLLHNLFCLHDLKTIYHRIYHLCPRSSTSIPTFFRIDRHPPHFRINTLLYQTIYIPFTQITMPSSSRFGSLSRFPRGIRSSFRRSTSSTMSGTSDSSYTSSTIETINTIMHRQPSMVDMAEERNTFGSGLEILEPRPVVYWGSLSERMGSS